MDDSDYFGATLAALAIGVAPGNYSATPEVQTSLKLLREYLNREFAVQTTINRTLLLWAAATLPGLLEPDRQKAIIAELLEKQRADGGWSLSSLSGDWKRADGTSQETTRLLVGFSTTNSTRVWEPTLSLNQYRR